MGNESYKNAGVDVEAGYESVRLIKDHIAKTHIPGVLSDIGGFGGLFQPNLEGIKNPVLVSGTDGVGTKLKIAFIMDKHNTVGIDCVAMCVNDIICSGARPLFFLDYIALGKNIPAKTALIVEGVSEGCVQAGCALIGGETAEMPGFYAEGEYDLAGFSVGIVDKDNITDVNRQEAGDVLIGIASRGVHSNGFSLVRKIFGAEQKSLEKYYDELGEALGNALLTPTKIYVKPLLSLMEKIVVKSVSHITGGGFYENIPRSVKKGLSAKINKGSWEVLPIFELISKAGNIPERDMFNTFNMGIGMCISVSAGNADEAVRILNLAGEKAFIIGELVNSDSSGGDSGELILC